MTNNLKNSAEMMVTSFSNFPEDVQKKMKQAYEEQRYQDVLNLAANHDIRNRVELDSKAKAIFNPDFELRDMETKEPIPNVEETLSSWELDMIMFASKDGVTSWSHYEWDEGQQMYLFQAEDVAGRIFKTSADAIDAYCLKQGIDRHDKSKKHQFTRHLVQIDEELSTPEEGEEEKEKEKDEEARSGDGD